MVRTQITAAGLKILSDVDVVVKDEHKRRFRSLDESQLRTLIELLTIVRQNE